MNSRIMPRQISSGESKIFHRQDHTWSLRAVFVVPVSDAESIGIFMAATEVLMKINKHNNYYTFVAYSAYNKT